MTVSSTFRWTAWTLEAVLLIKSYGENRHLLDQSTVW